MNILVHGTLDFDRIMHYPGRFQDAFLVDQLHKLNLSLLIDDTKIRFGGGGGAIAYTLKMLGEQPIILSAIGGDGQQYLQHLQRLGISTEYIEVYPDAQTSTFTVVNDDEHYQVAFFYPGALHRNVPFSTADFNPAQTIMILSPRDNNNETIAYAHQCMRERIRYIFDPGQTIARYAKSDFRRLVEGATMLTINEYELETVKRRFRISELEILQWTETLITTLGGDGSRIQTRDQTIHIPRVSSDAIVDTTSAGDAYRAGVLKGIAIGATLEQMGRFGSVAAAYAIEHYGSQEHHFTIEQFCDRYEKNYTEPCPVRKF
ncbi:MAG: carbohydrate kinase family protein [Candidatus Kerfeldbacteria bacterium]|nr:carbohydrate kinase family protein [Candidatus Kerfeldbacteria bacterium]